MTLRDELAALEAAAQVAIDYSFKECDIIPSQGITKRIRALISQPSASKAFAAKVRAERNERLFCGTHLKQYGIDSPGTQCVVCANLNSGAASEIARLTTERDEAKQDLAIANDNVALANDASQFYVKQAADARILQQHAEQALADAQESLRWALFWLVNSPMRHPSITSEEFAEWSKNLALARQRSGK